MEVREFETSRKISALIAEVTKLTAGNRIVLPAAVSKRFRLAGRRRRSARILKQWRKLAATGADCRQSKFNRNDL